jgi:hypothetical protein
MLDGGITLLVLAAVAGVAYLLANTKSKDDLKPSEQEMAKGDGAAAQPMGPAAVDVPSPASLDGTGVTGNFKAASPATSVYDEQPIPVTAPAGGGGYLPGWTNPEVE